MLSLLIGCGLPCPVGAPPASSVQRYPRRENHMKECCGQTPYSCGPQPGRRAQIELMCYATPSGNPVADTVYQSCTFLAFLEMIQRLNYRVGLSSAYTCVANRCATVTFVLPTL